MVDGRYFELKPNQQGYLWSQQLELYLGVYNNQLRFFTPEGRLVPTAEERNEKLAAKLRELGIDPDDIGSITLGTNAGIGRR